MSLRQENSSYEASDESSENELLDRSLSLWRGWVAIDDDDDDFAPCPLDLHTASSIGHYECVRTIIARKEVDINICNKGGWTPLMYASYIGHENILNLLLKADADANITNHKGQTALMLAASCGNDRVAHCLCQNGAELEGQDYRGWTVLFHATYAGHQNMVKFLLERNVNMNARDPSTGLTPFLEAAAGGHEIIVQLFLQYGVSLNAKTYSGDTAQSLALMNGHMNIVNLINQHMAAREKDINSSEESTTFLTGNRPLHHPTVIGRPIQSKMARGPPDIRDGPDAFARLIERSKSSELANYPNSYVPEGYITFTQGNEERENTLLRYRDVTSPINPQDHNLDSSSSKESYDAEDESTAFSRTGALTIRSSSSSSGGLAAALGLSPDNSGDGEDILAPSLVGILPQESRDISQEFCSAFPTDLHSSHSSQISDNKETIFEEQDVDLQVFLSLTDNDLKEIGIKLFGPRRKMTSAIARWHSDVRSPSDGLERAYADRLEAEMQEMAIQLHQANSQVKTLEAQILQEQKLRSVTEGCFMEERAFRQREKLQLEDLCMRCEQTQEVFEQLRLYHADFGERLLSSFPSVRDQQDSDIFKNVDQLIKKVELCSNELKQTLDLVFKTLDNLLRQENSPPSYLSPNFA
ncbi:Ankyrin repeat and SAM domain-containing protein 3 [Acanthosepion pharaonis]|uniref:Ankyrin repeat and SAM domain-containing protein 3 n=1 Tax=Acanthosepion pharaonis TaxID=158019 RepID=A0A812ECQ2_ACAPH|nr:Ankyrin repeat and SAM domain-containing protein 3 [Sepia pharaonis]